jgi:hypothetical protein
MPNDLPTSPEVLAEATHWSINDLAIMSPKEMSPEAELTYVEHLRELAARYERALGVAKAKPAAKAKASSSPKGTASAPSLAILDVDTSGEGGDASDLF